MTSDTSEASATPVAAGTPGDVATPVSGLVPLNGGVAVVEKPKVPTNLNKKADEYDDDEAFGNSETNEVFNEFDMSRFTFPDMDKPCATPVTNLTFTVYALAKLIYFLQENEN